MREATMDDEDFMRELVDIYLGDTPGQLETLRRAVAAGDPAATGAAAHRLKGASGNVGAESLVALCLRLEQAGRENRLAEMPALFEEIRGEFGRVRETLEQMKQNWL